MLVEITVRKAQTVAVNTVVGPDRQKPASAAAAPARGARGARDRLRPPPAAPATRRHAPRRRAGRPRSAGSRAPQPAPAADAPTATSGCGSILSPLVRRSRPRKASTWQSSSRHRRAHGRVTKDDILAYLDSGSRRPRPPPAPCSGRRVGVRTRRRGRPCAEPPRPRPAAGPGRLPRPGLLPGENVEIEPMSKIRGRSRRRTWSTRRRTSAHVTTVFHVDFTKIASSRARAKDGFARQGRQADLHAVHLQGRGRRRSRPTRASTPRSTATNIVYKKDINLGMAVALDWGLIVPVIKNAEELSLVGLAKSRQRPRRPRAQQEAQARRGPGRHLHHHQPGRLRQPLRHADHQPATGGDPRRRRDRKAAHRGRSTRTATTPRHQDHVLLRASPTTTAWSTAPTPTAS